MSEYKTHSNCKKHFKNAFVSFVALSLIFSGIALSGCASGPKTPDDLYDLYLDISSEENAFFNKYAMTVSLDGEEIGSVNNGEVFTYLANVTRGDHTIEFCKEGKSKPKLSKNLQLPKTHHIRVN